MSTNRLQTGGYARQQNGEFILSILREIINDTLVVNSMPIATCKSNNYHGI